MDKVGQGEGGGQKSLKFCGHHMYMAPYVARARTLTNAPYLAIAVPFYSVQKSELLSCMFFKVVHKALADGGSGLSGRPLIYTCKRVI